MDNNGARVYDEHCARLARLGDPVPWWWGETDEDYARLYERYKRYLRPGDDEVDQYRAANRAAREDRALQWGTYPMIGRWLNYVGHRLSTS